jgi:hypothetical protein
MIDFYDAKRRSYLYAPEDRVIRYTKKHGRKTLFVLEAQAPDGRLLRKYISKGEYAQLTRVPFATRPD